MLHFKQQKSKVQYGKLLAQLEASEMARRELGDKVRELVEKCHKLKREKRDAAKDINLPLSLQRKSSVSKQVKKKDSNYKRPLPQVKVVVCNK